MKGALRGAAATNGAPATNGTKRPHTVRVVIVDDQEVMRRGLRALLGEEQEIEIVAEADNGDDAVRLVAELTPEVVLMDVVMPGMNGIDATRQIKERQPGTRVIGMSIFDGQDASVKMLAAGADSFVAKTRASDLLVDTIFRRPPRRS